MQKKTLFNRKESTLIKEKDLFFEICMLDLELEPRRQRGLWNVILTDSGTVPSRMKSLMWLFPISSTPSSNPAKRKSSLLFTSD